MNKMKEIVLSDYRILLDDSLTALRDFLQQHTYSKLIVLVDENTHRDCLPLLQEVQDDLEVILTPSGEVNKNIDTCELIWQEMMRGNADRKALCINLGGGVLGDMGGFAASCYKRGIDFINIPTTLLSQVDSSIGGKLGIDFKYGKNLIGLFRNPKLVLISSRFFETLPQRQYINGWAEIFKHALIQDAAQWERYRNLDILQCDINEIVYQSLHIKKAVVEEDPFEKGLRKILNFGHTIGHAIEAYSLEHEQDSLLHGEAIAIGMISEAYLSVKKCGLPQVALDDIVQVLLTHFPKHDITGFDAEEMLQMMSLDKKNEGSTILAALLSAIGNCVYDVPLSSAEIRESIAYYNSL